MKRVLFAVGMLLSGWRWLLTRHKRNTPPQPKSLITEPDDQNRFLPFESIANLRDIGGYKTVEGKTVKWKQVYRGASLAYVNENEQEQLNVLNLQVVCDLRRHDEISHAPDNVPEGARYLNIPSMDSINKIGQIRNLLFKPRYIEQMMGEIYIEAILENNPEMFGIVYRQIIEGNLPLLIHCTAGKDRTGLAIALLLRVLGVNEETVLNDYSLSNHYYDYFKRISGRLVKRLQQVGFSEDDVSPLLMADKRNLKMAIEHIEHKYGSIEAYLSQRANISTQDIELLKARLLE